MGEAPVPLIAATRVYTCTELFISIPSASFPRILNKLTPCIKQMSSVLVNQPLEEIHKKVCQYQRDSFFRGPHSFLPGDSDRQLHDNIIAKGVSTRAYKVGHADETPPPFLCRLFMSVSFIRQWLPRYVGEHKLPLGFHGSPMFINPRITGYLQPSILTDLLSTRFPSLILYDRWDQLEGGFLEWAQN